MKRFFAAAALALTVLSCGGDPPAVLDVSGGVWPEGTCVSVLRDGKTVTSSSLFGGRLTLTLPGPGEYTVRAAHPDFLTALSPRIRAGAGTTAHELPIPVTRRRIGTVRLGFAFTSPDDDSLCASLIDRGADAFTSVSFTRREPDDLDVMVSRAHARAVEVILRNGPGTAGTVRSARKTVDGMIRSAERSGADGVMLIPGGGLRFDDRTRAAVRELSARVHGLGMTFSLGVRQDVPGGFDPVKLFRDVPSAECPDELVLLCDAVSPEDGAMVSVSRVESALLAMQAATIPLSRVSVEITLGARAWEQDGKTRRPLALERGTLARISREAGEGSALRLGDGSLSLAYRGVTYEYEDLAGIAEKMAFLRTGEFARVRGVRIVYDGTGPEPDVEGMRRLADVFGR